MQRDKSDTLEYSCFLSLMRIGDRLQKEGNVFFSDITIKQWMLLSQLEQAGTALTPTELQHRLGTTHQNIRQIVDKLASKGYVQSTRHPQDGRARLIHLTDKAKKFPHFFRYHEVSFLQALFRAIPQADIEAALRLLSRLEGNLDKMGT